MLLASLGQRGAEMHANETRLHGDCARRRVDFGSPVEATDQALDIESPGATSNASTRRLTTITGPGARRRTSNARVHHNSVRKAHEPMRSTITPNDDLTAAATPSAQPAPTALGNADLINARAAPPPAASRSSARQTHHARPTTTSPGPSDAA